MSEKIDIIVDSSTDVEAGNEIVSASTDNNIDIEILEPDYDVTINKREYVITGDNMYIPRTYDESPQWLKDIIGTITDFSLNQKLTEIGALSNTLYGLIEELNVAKNAYTNSIITSAKIDEIINARIETLNSSIAESDATIVDIISTKATPTEASSMALNVLTASINDGAISSLVSNLQNAISTTNSTLSNNIDIVHSEMTGEFKANAEVIDAIETSVTNINGTLTSHAGQITTLQASASAVDGKIATAKSEVVNTVNTTITNGDAVVESKWAYNSSLNIGGTTYNSGFGLSNSSGTGVGSEFWVDASRFKFTNSSKTGSVAPFTIDASGATPQIAFNGKVQFSNINNVPTINKTYVQATQPSSGMNLGDTWIDTDDNNSLYSYNGTTWNKTQSGNKTFLQATAPTTGMIAGDIWVDSDNNYKQYRYSGSAWVEYLYNPATAINAGTTTINGPKITTGSITASQISSASITADRLSPTTGTTTTWKGGGLVSNNFNGNADGAIGSPTAGFRLSSDAAGTSVDPTIYGAYIKGATIEASKFLGALSQTTSFNGVVNGLSTSLSHIKTITMSAPKNGAHNLLIVANLVPVGGNWNTIYYDIRVNGASIIGIQSTGGIGMGNGGSYNRTLIAGPYETSVSIEIYGYQNNANGYAYPQTGTDISISAIGVA